MHVTPPTVALGEGEGRRRRQLEPLERARALYRDQPVVVGDVTDVGSTHLALLEPRVVRLAVRGVDDQEVVEPLELVDDQVVDDPAALVRQERVLGAARLDPAEVVREQPLEQFGRPGAVDLELAHVRDVERAGVLAHRPVLLDHALVLDGHLPAGERHHPRPEGDVAVVQRGAAERLHRGGCYCGCAGCRSASRRGGTTARRASPRGCRSPRPAHARARSAAPARRPARAPAGADASGAGRTRWRSR